MTNQNEHIQISYVYLSYTGTTYRIISHLALRLSPMELATNFVQQFKETAIIHSVIVQLTINSRKMQEELLCI